MHQHQSSSGLTWGPPDIEIARLEALGHKRVANHQYGVPAKGRHNFMKTLLLPLPVLSILFLALGCGGNYPPPTQQMADVQAANRSAIELGAQENPKAELHLKLAEEQLAKARQAMKEDDNETAERWLMRAKADAELSVALTREEQARMSASKAVDQSNAQAAANAVQGALR